MITRQHSSMMRTDRNSGLNWGAGGLGHTLPKD